MLAPTKAERFQLVTGMKGQNTFIGCSLIDGMCKHHQKDHWYLQRRKIPT